MNRTVSRLQIRKLFIIGLCICFLIGNMLFVSNSALAISLPPGEYEIPYFNRHVPLPGEIPYSPYAGRPDEYQPSHPQQVFWGDTHLHTIYSFDAGAAGTTLTPENSYRFARGEEVTTDGGQPVQLSRPLDFLVVTDHTDQLGSFQQFVDYPPQDCGDDQQQIDDWHEAIEEGGDAAANAQNEITSAFAQGTIPACMLQSPEEFGAAWDNEVDWAEEFNDPHKFTAVIGYEWTSLDAGDNLHRNVIFRDNGDKAKQLLPKTTADGTDPELLWAWMQNYEDTTGGDVLAIPHNGNLSNGKMFADTDARGMPLNHSYAEQRQLWEPLYEVIQIKGAGETHPFLSPDDEFASFEIAGWDNGNLDLTAPETPDMYEHEYARAALKNGLKFEEDLGANPFKFGLVGSTDSHIGISGVEENSFMGKFPIYTPSPERAEHVSKTSCFTKDQDGNCVPENPEVNRFGWQYGAAGFVGVWAEANTRESLFDAMARREVYATSGPRMIVRFFGGWDFTSEDVSFNPGQVGYAKGVPMGSDLTSMPEGKVPTFLVAALKDPIRGNLDRIQIVKGWLENGQTQEKVYDVVWSGDRVPNDTTGKLPLVGCEVNPAICETDDPMEDTGTVNTDTAEWTNSIGAVELAQVWTDPDFDPTQKAFYYARVLEIPTPRWTDYDKVFYQIEMAEEIPLTLQERVYTSPIWYSPSNVTSEIAPLPENPEDGSDFDFWNRIIHEVIR
ncbi:DUF3604 domain-containing protein [Moorena sp. SIO1G6]|uniref:DUF3604 domain-containing protein n=2 Tax=unclassified Moorena TaxID=2683338 RepID=UPI00257B8233|nr:DUF3604 domain-containing protein [Moorena sp. SIO1G6]